MGTVNETSANPLAMAKQTLVTMIPDEELRSFSRWYVSARTRHSTDPRFFGLQNSTHESLLYTVLLWIYGGRPSDAGRC